MDDNKEIDFEVMEKKSNLSLIKISCHLSSKS